MNEYAHYEAGSHKLLSDNRAAYFAQSAATSKATTNGRAATFPPSSSAAATPLSLVAGGLEPDYAAYQEPQEVIPYAERRGI